MAERHLRLNPDDALALAIRAGRPDITLQPGCIFALLGLVEPALDCLEKAERSGLTQMGWYKHSSNLDRLREQARAGVIPTLEAAMLWLRIL